jgi:hypothetical protein
MPNHEPIIQFFAFSHLPLDLQTVSRPFCDLAISAAVRAKLYAD